MTPDRALAEANVRAAEAWIAQGKVALDVARRALRTAVEREIRVLPPIAHVADYAGVVASFTVALGEPYFVEDGRTVWEFKNGGILVVEVRNDEVEVCAFVDGAYGGDGVDRWTVCHTLDGVFKDALCSLAHEGVFVAVNAPRDADVSVPVLTFDRMFDMAVARYGKPSLRDVSAGFAYWPRLPRSSGAGSEMDGVTLSDEDDDGRVVVVATGNGAGHVCEGDGEEALDDAHRWMVAHGGPMRPEAS